MAISPRSSIVEHSPDERKVLGAKPSEGTMKKKVKCLRCLGRGTDPVQGIWPELSFPCVACKRKGKVDDRQ